MPTSHSPKQSARTPLAPKRARFLWPLVLVVVVAVVTVGLIALPASLIQHFLPPSIRAQDFTGTVWHGSTEKITVDSHDAGALEWRLRPWSLVTLTLTADVHWVKVGFVADARVDADRQGVTARDVQGGGPLENLRDLGMAPGLHGMASFKFSELKLAFESGSPRLLSAVGTLNVSDLGSPRIAGGADLGGYALRLADGAITPDADATAELTDTGGPLEVRATIHFSANDRTAMLSGTIRGRTDAPVGLRNQLNDLAQLHARDAEGRIPVELEFTL